jgi:hypothetical protein
MARTKQTPRKRVISVSRWKTRFYLGRRVGSEYLEVLRNEPEQEPQEVQPVENGVEEEPMEEEPMEDESMDDAPQGDQEAAGDPDDDDGDDSDDSDDDDDDSHGGGSDEEEEVVPDEDPEEPLDIIDLTGDGDGDAPGDGGAPQPPAMGWTVTEEHITDANTRMHYRLEGVIASHFGDWGRCEWSMLVAAISTPWSPHTGW